MPVNVTKVAGKGVGHHYTFMSDLSSANYTAAGRVIFDSSLAGHDAALMHAAGDVIVAAAVLVVYAVIVGSAYKRGKPLTSRKRLSMAILSFVGRNSNPIIGATLVLAIAAVAWLHAQWSADRERLAAGDYARVQGVITTLVVTAVGVQNRHTSSSNPPLETDELIVARTRFRLLCIAPGDGLVPTVGDRGTCLNAAVGNHVEVDYVQVTPTTYRGEPLRIILLDP